MIKKGCLRLSVVVLVVALVFSMFVSAEDGTNATVSPGYNESLDSNLTTNMTNKELINTSLANESQEQIKYINFNVTGFVPKEFKVGDVQFNIQIKNTGDVELRNIVGIVSGKGFSTYDVIPIDSLKPGEKLYLLVMGNLKEEGNITLSIKINDKVFYQDITAIDPNSKEKIENLQKMQEAEKQRAEALTALSAKLEELKTSYRALEKEYDEKKKKYDVSGIKLDEDIKEFIQNAESSIIAKDLEKANISITLGLEEYYFQKEKLKNVELIKKSALEVFKNNIVIFSTIAASIITLFSFYELMKKKKEVVSQQFIEGIKVIKKTKKEEKEIVKKKGAKKEQK